MAIYGIQSGSRSEIDRERVKRHPFAALRGVCPNQSTDQWHNNTVLCRPMAASCRAMPHAALPVCATRIGVGDMAVQQLVV